MPNDLYDNFLKERDRPIFSEITNKVRQKIWCDSINFIISQNWMNTEDRIFIELYYYLRYN